MIFEKIKEVIFSRFSRDLLVKFNSMKSWKKTTLVLLIIAIIYLIENNIRAFIYVSVLNKYKFYLLIIAFIFIVLLMISGNKNYKIKVISLICDEETEFLKNYRLIVQNVSIKDVNIVGLRVKYRYYSGMCEEIGEYRSIDYKNEYIVDLPIDFCVDSRQEITNNFDNTIKIFGKRGVNNNEFDFRFSLTYSMPEEKNWHPCSDWNIMYEVYMFDDNQIEYPMLLNQKWRSRFNTILTRKESTIVNRYLYYNYTIEELYLLHRKMYLPREYCFERIRYGRNSGQKPRNWIVDIKLWYNNLKKS